MHLLTDWLKFDSWNRYPGHAHRQTHPDQAFSTVAQHVATHQIYLDTLFSEVIKEKANNTWDDSYIRQTIASVECIINIYLINAVFIIINIKLGGNLMHKAFPKGAALQYSGIKLFPSFHTDTPLKSLRLNGHKSEFNILQMCIYIKNIGCIVLRNAILLMVFFQHLWLLAIIKKTIPQTVLRSYDIASTLSSTSWFNICDTLVIRGVWPSNMISTTQSVKPHSAKN